MTDPTAAAERLRRLANAKQAMPISDAANMVREFTNSFIAGDQPVKHQNTMELFQATLVLAGAWLDDHTADDAKLIAGWIDSEFVYPEGMDDWKRNIVERWIDKMPNATVGQLRLLLRALSQEPQP